jgi:hypothetical protein
VSDVRFLGAAAGLVLDYAVLPHRANGSRVVTLVLGHLRGRTAVVAKRVFEVMDYVMASEQLRGLKWRVETYAGRQEREVSAPCAGVGDHQRDSITYAGQAEVQPSG